MENLMLETGKTYRYKNVADKDDVYILGRLLDIGEYHNFAVYFVNRETKDTVVGEMEIRKDSLGNFEEVKE